jgi:hypothetical protein
MLVGGAMSFIGVLMTNKKTFKLARHRLFDGQISESK